MNPTIGQDVFWTSYSKSGIILSEMDSSKKVLIDAGGVKIRVPVSELKAINRPKTAKSHVQIKYDYESAESSELNLTFLFSITEILNKKKCSV